MKRLADKEIDLVLESSARDLIVTEGYDPDYGARPMRRLDDGARSRNISCFD